MKKKVVITIVEGLVAVIVACITAYGGYKTGVNNVEQRIDNKVSQVVEVDNGNIGAAIDYIISRNEEVDEKNNILKDENIKLNNELKLIQAEIEDLKNKNQELENQNKNLESKNEDLESKNKDLESKNKELKYSVDKIKTDSEPNEDSEEENDKMIDLFTLKPFIGSGSYIYKCNDILNNIGESYSGYCFGCNSLGDGSVTYHLNKEYKLLTADFALRDRNRSDGSKYKVEFYGDDIKIGESKAFTRGELPQTDFSLDISNVVDLRLEFIGNSRSPYKAICTHGFFIQK